MLEVVPPGVEEYSRLINKKIPLLPNQYNPG